MSLPSVGTQWLKVSNNNSLGQICLLFVFSGNIYYKKRIGILALAKTILIKHVYWSASCIHFDTGLLKSVKIRNNLSGNFTRIYIVSVHGATVRRSTTISYLFCRNVHCVWFILLRDHAIPFFIELNCLPLQSLFFQQLSYLMYDIHAKIGPKSLLDKFTKISTTHHYNTRLSAKECFSVKFSRTEKMKKSFTRIGVSIWNSIPHSVKTLNLSNFRKKVKSLLLNILYNEDNYLNVTCLIEYFKKLTWYAVYTS